MSGPKNWDRHGRQGVGNLEEGEKGGYPERREYARRRLLEWASKARVVDEIARRYQVDPRTASRDVRAVWEAVAEEQSSSRVAETARAIALLEDQIERVQASDERATAKARAISDLVDRLARLGGLYPEANQVRASTWAVLSRVGQESTRLEAARAAQLDDGAIDAAIAHEQLRLGVGLTDEDVAALARARLGLVAVADLDGIAEDPDDEAGG